MGRRVSVLAFALAWALAVPGSARADWGDGGGSSIVSTPPLDPRPAPFVDVPTSHWGYSQINDVGTVHDWMPSSSRVFSPLGKTSRRVMARALVRAFAADAVVDPTIAIGDIAESSSWYRYANVVVAKHWFSTSGGDFKPDATVSKRDMDEALVRAMGLYAEAAGLANMATEDGYKFAKPTKFGYLTIAQELHLHYNYHDGEDGKDLYPWDAVRNEFFAYALAQAVSQSGGWGPGSVAGFKTITLPRMGAGRRAIVEFAIKYVGYPYVYGHEWYRGSPHGGFDCSGFQWWVMKSSSDGYPVAKVRPYRGWSISNRRASLIAREAPSAQRIWGSNYLMAGDLVFFDADGNDPNYLNIDHGGVALGNGWFIHSSGSRAGVTLGFLGEGSWWRDSFVMGRRLVG